MASENFFLILVDQPSTSQRNAVHARVKKGTSGWWHNFNDAWIVRGGTTQDWSARLQPVFKTGTAGFLVFELPGSDTTRSWSYFGPNASTRLSWLHKSYTRDR